MIPSLIAPILNKAGQAYVISGWGSDRTGMSGRDPLVPAIHKGLDFPAAIGTSVRAVAAGTVVGTYDWGASGGMAVVLEHEGGLRSRYLHVSKFLVKKGERVAQGQEIAKSGATGIKESAAHLHFDLQIPEKLLTEWFGRFGHPDGIAVSTYTGVPAEPLVPATFAPKVKDTAAKYGVVFYTSTGITAALFLLLGVGYFLYNRNR